MKTLSGTVRGLVVFLCLALSSTAQAMITVHHGVYRINTIVMNSESRPEAVLNSFTRSQCRIQLTGPVAQQLRKVATTPRGMKLKIKISKDSHCGIISAELLQFRELRKERIPTRVLNDFVAQ